MRGRCFRVGLWGLLVVLAVGASPGAATAGLPNGELEHIWNDPLAPEVAPPLGTPEDDAMDPYTGTESPPPGTKPPPADDDSVTAPEEATAPAVAEALTAKRLLRLLRLLFFLGS